MLQNAVMTNNAARILVIEDEPKIARWLVALLEQAKFSVVTAPDGATGLRLAETEHPDVVLLDLMLPDMDGLDVCRIIRQRSDVLILMLTARIDDTDRLIGLEMGADDYITKPFNPREVIARIRAFLRRANGLLVTEAKSLTFGPLVLNPSARTCTLNSQPVLLTPTEFVILETLMRHPGMVYTRESLITEALGYDYAAYERTIDAHIRNLRRKIEVDMRDPQYIQTVFGVGYRFAERQEQGA
jgi:DNA-binding response OmpR family regulator